MSPVQINDLLARLILSPIYNVAIVLCKSERVLRGSNDIEGVGDVRLSNGRVLLNNWVLNERLLNWHLVVN